jgi:pre-mRNA-splicing factor ATP-dependent RNA helicase DHX15/PRP43
LEIQDEEVDYYPASNPVHTPNWSVPIATKNAVLHTFDVVRQILQTSPNKKDILVLIRNEEDIHATSELVKRLGNIGGPLRVFPLCDFDDAASAEISKDDGVRKVILCTSAKEASYALHRFDDIVDGGLEMQKSQCPDTGMDVYTTRTITPLSYRQRAACAQSSDVGMHHTLYPLPESKTESDLEETFEYQTPEILRVNFRSVLLELKRLHHERITSFKFMQNPSTYVVTKACVELIALDFMCPTSLGLSEEGKIAAEFPIEPQLAHMVLHSSDYHCTGEILSLAALLSVPSIFLRPHGSYEEADRAKVLFAHPFGDHLTLLNAYRQFKIGISTLVTLLMSSGNGSTVVCSTLSLL